jgi:hypothetical protein
VDLEGKAVRAGGRSFPLTMPESHRRALVTGLWDSTAELLPGLAATRKLAAGIPYLGWSAAR